MAAVRAKAKAREERMPLVGLTTKAQADRLLGSSMAGCWQPDTALPLHQQMALERNKGCIGPVGFDLRV